MTKLPIAFRIRINGDRLDSNGDLVPFEIESGYVGFIKITGTYNNNERYVSYSYN